MTKTLDTGFRKYYNVPLQQLIDEELQNHHPYHATRYAKARQRMYANLFSRDCRKVLLKLDSVCAQCGSTHDLEIDHIIPISKGGKNEIENTQILCQSCNIKKSNK